MNDQPPLKNIIEGALLAAGGPLTLDSLLGLFGTDEATPTREALQLALATLEEDYRNRVDRQVRLAKALNRISPAAGFVYTATEMAGTGIGEDSRLKREVVRYRDQVLQTGTLENNMAPAFSYKYRPLGEVMAEGGLFDIAWLLVFNVFFFAAGFVRFLRYDAR